MPEPLSAPGADASFRVAATVVVLRDAPAGPEALMVRRCPRSGFAADAWVFPGGTVDDADRRLDPARWTGIDPEALAPRFAASDRDVLGLHVAAVRETWEEAGLLLGADPGAVPSLVAREPGGDAFADLLERHGVVLDLGVLEYWSRWVTPAAERRRYDARFFVARAPAGQEPTPDLAETTALAWFSPRDVLDRSSDGSVALVYPTRRNLEEMATVVERAGHDAGVGALLRHARDRPRIRRIQPHAERGPDGSWRILHPDEPGHPDHGDLRPDQQVTGRTNPSRPGGHP